ncbi:AAA family ATPase [Paraburkholderia sediminicola]|uniref:AAA family ATPase n=1 Tax=Paraburkholderia sediminicola TaxID=458836 RepID=UPI0038B995D1
MSQVEAIRVKNLRALQDTGFIALKQITLLVGRNSVGKSTFARVFPLLRQSVEENRRAPLLWWGKYVDFGSFDEALSRGANDKAVSVAFKIAIPKTDDERPSYAERPLLCEDGVCEIEVSIEKDGGNTYLSKVVISIFDLSCEIAIGADQRVQRIQSGTDVWEPSADVTCIVDGGEVVPNLMFFRTAKDSNGALSYRWIEPLKARLAQHVSHYAHGNTTQTKLNQIANAIPIGSPESTLRVIRGIRGSQTWVRSVKEFSVTGYPVRKLRTLALLAQLPALLSFANEQVKNYSKGVRYLEPLRATAQRYYRPQELSVDEIDSKGGNIAIFFNSLSTEDLKDLNEWMSKYLGLRVIPEKSGGHISLKVALENSSQQVNIADMGFGISQVLPIAAQMWSAARSAENAPYAIATAASCIVIEQPELHLHPAFQARLADLFVALFETENEEGDGVGQRQRVISAAPRIVAETHSSSLVNRLGELVADGRIKKDEVQVVMFNQAGPDDPVTVHVSEFDSDGVLQNWPFGFFASGFTE